MSDNITLPGTGVGVATDDVSGVQFQKVKLVDGTADSAAVIPGGADGLAVDIRKSVDLVVIDFAHQEIHDGDAFMYAELITLGAAGVQDYLLTVPDTLKVPHFVYNFEGIFGVTFELYAESTHGGTTIQTTYNRNRNSATVAGMTVHKGATAGADGDRIRWRQSGSSTSQGKLSASHASHMEIVLKQNKKYVVRLTSLAALNAISVDLSWYEHAV